MSLEPFPCFRTPLKPVNSYRRRHHIDDTVIELGELPKLIYCLSYRLPFRFKRDSDGRDSTRYWFLGLGTQLDHEDGLPLFPYRQVGLAFCLVDSWAVANADLDW